MEVNISGLPNLPRIEGGIELNTFSIAAHDPATGSFGVAVSTARPCVGSLVPFVSLNGAIATQARVNTELGRQGILLVEQGVPIKSALQNLLDSDDESARRQIHGVTAEEVFAFSGPLCVDWFGHREGKGFTIAGNMLAGPQVIEAMAEAFEAARSSSTELSDALIQAMEAGQAAGGDKRGKQSSALLIASQEPRMYHNLRVDDHADPVAELRRIHEIVVEQSRGIENEYGAEGLRLFSRVKY